MKKIIFFSIFLIIITSLAIFENNNDNNLSLTLEVEEIEIVEKITQAGGGDNPGFIIQYPSGTNIFRVGHDGNANISSGNLTVSDLRIAQINSTHWKMWG